MVTVATGNPRVDLPERLEMVLEPTPLADVVHPHIPGYHIEELLGSGGMGAVYRARQQDPERGVALKIMHAEVVTPTALRRFRREIGLLRGLEHPGLVPVWDSGFVPSRLGDRPFFTMERVEGELLSSFVRGLPGQRERIELFLEICDGVAYLHEHGIVHRDLKPSNVIVTPEGRPRLIDLGLARRLDPDGTTSQTLIGHLIGTAAYMSPEQARGLGGLSGPGSDIYTLGVILYELVCDRLPYDTSSGSASKILQTIQETTPELSRRELSRDLRAVLSRALGKRVEDRYPDVPSFALDLRRYLAHRPVSARSPTRLHELRLAARRLRPVLVPAAIVGAVLALGVGVAVSGWRSAAEESRRDEVTLDRNVGLISSLLEVLERLQESESLDPEGLRRTIDALDRLGSERPQDGRLSEALQRARGLEARG